MAVAGKVPGDPDHVLVGVVVGDTDPDPTLSIWIGTDVVTDIRLDDAEKLANILLFAIRDSRSQQS